MSSDVEDEAAHKENGYESGSSVRDKRQR